MDGLSVNIGGGGCAGCNTGYFPYDFTGKYMCIDRDYLRVRKNAHNDDENCKAYKFIKTTENRYVCQLCADGTYLYQGTCLTATECLAITNMSPFRALRDITTFLLKKNMCADSTNDYVISSNTGVEAECEVLVLGRETVT